MLVCIVTAASCSWITPSSFVLETKARKNNQSNSHGQRRNRDILRQQCRRGLSAFLSSSRPSPEPPAPKVLHPCCSAQSPLHCPTPPKPTHFSALCSQSYSFPLPLSPSDSVSLSLCENEPCTTHINGNKIYFFSIYKRYN